MCQVIVYISTRPRGCHVTSELANKSAVFESRDPDSANHSVVSSQWDWCNEGLLPAEKFSSPGRNGRVAGNMKWNIRYI